MSNGYEEARGQRNFLERLGDKIPGYRGFQDRELRRDVDRLQREHLASELGRLKNVLRERARDYTDAGKIGVLSRFDRLDRQLDGLSQAVRFSDYGATGLFDPVKIGDAELQRLYEFDLSLVDDLAVLESQIAAVPRPGAEDPAATLDQLLQSARTLDDKWREREQVIGNVVRTAQPGGA
ncbi:MAG TPA: hypothetical protein VLE27_12965 [Thermoanaerobaculia bacterium]|nr:hypothetical protein [Thermoanaerobaculia bacterium]